MLILEQKLVLYGKTTSAASGKCSRFPIRYNIAKDSLLISNSFTNNFSISFRFQSTSSAKCSWPGSEFTRWPTRLSYAGVCVLRLAFNLLWMKFPVPSSPVPQNNLVFSAFSEFEMKKSSTSPT